MKKLILIAVCMSLMALGSAGSAGAYSQSGLTYWNSGETATLHFNLPVGNVIDAWLDISAISPVGSNDYIYINKTKIGVLLASANGVLQSTKINVTDFFAHYVSTGLPPSVLNVTINADGPLSLGPSTLTLDTDSSSNGSNAPVPEPATLLLLGSGLSGLAFWGKRRRVAV